MKLKKFLAFALMAATALNFTACSDDDDDDDAPQKEKEEQIDENESKDDDTNIKIKLSESSIDLEVGKTATITAIVEPEDADVEYKWSIEDEDIAKIANADEEEVVIKGVKAGETTLKVKIGDKSKTCFINVTKAKTDPIDDPVSVIKDYKYFVITMPDADFDKIAEDALDMRVNDADMFFQIWDTHDYKNPAELTYKSLEVTSGYGVEVDDEGWSGLGFNYQNKTLLANMSKITEDNGEGWYFHISIKVNSDVPQLIGFDGETGSYKFAINGDYNDNGSTYHKIADIPTDGNFHDVEVSMTNAINAGLIYSNKPTKALNLVWVLSGGVQGTQLYIDNIYFYKK